jgi:hypothetical protein
MFACFWRASGAYADCEDCTREPWLNSNLQRDHIAVQNFMDLHRNIPLIEKSKFLKITGDVRAKWNNRHEKQGKISLRGGGFRDVVEVEEVDGKEVVCIRKVPKAAVNTYEAELNLRFEYRAGDKSWGFAHLQFDNDFGAFDFDDDCDENPCGAFGSGFCDDICLKRMYFGYEIWKRDHSRIIVEIGRRPLYTIFDSYIEFNERFDGILFKYTDRYEKYAEFYVQVAPFVVDQRSNHFAYIGEVGFLNFFESRFDIQYSFVDWTKHGKNRCFRERCAEEFPAREAIRKGHCNLRNPRGWQFRNSQLILSYNFPTDIISHETKLFVAGLCNHDARRLRGFVDDSGHEKRLPHTKANLGWYAGFITGDVEKAGDWSLDVNYQYVEAQAIPDPDIHGIGRGNILKESFTALNNNYRGKGNYKGWSFELLYAITNKLSVDATLQWSKAANNKIGGSHHFTKFELDLICGF